MIRCVECDKDLLNTSDEVALVRTWRFQDGKDVSLHTGGCFFDYAEKNGFYTKTLEESDAWKTRCAS